MFHRWQHEMLPELAWMRRRLRLSSRQAGELRAAIFNGPQWKAMEVRDRLLAARPTRTARADVDPVRQRTQYTCMSTSMMMCLRALGYDTDEDEVNKVMGAQPMQGACWENALACANHYGCVSTLRVPSTVRQLKEWTDAKIPVMIAWNPEGRDWSHASTVYHVAEGPIDTLDDTQMLMGDGPGLYIWVADPNIPHPDKTTRIVHEEQFYSRWYEKWPNYLVRRPACAIQREITPDGRQVLAKAGASLVHTRQWWRVPLEQWAEYLITDLAPARGIRSNKLPQVVEAFALDLGRNGEPLPEWLIWLGKREAVDTKRQHRKGVSMGAAQRLAFRYLNACSCDGSCGGSCGGCATSA